MRLYENDIQERICNAMDTLPVKAAVPYQSKRIGPMKGRSFSTVILTADGMRRPTIPGLKSPSRYLRASIT